MADEFRMQQKREALDAHGQRHGKSRYGCCCCRSIAGLAFHKRVTRKRARARLVEAVRRARRAGQDQGETP